jgi:hypothetical protein
VLPLHHRTVTGKVVFSFAPRKAKIQKLGPAEIETAQTATANRTCVFTFRFSVARFLCAAIAFFGN